MGWERCFTSSPVFVAAAHPSRSAPEFAEQKPLFAPDGVQNPPGLLGAHLPLRDGHFTLGRGATLTGLGALGRLGRFALLTRAVLRAGAGLVLLGVLALVRWRFLLLALGLVFAFILRLVGRILIVVVLVASAAILRRLLLADEIEQGLQLDVVGSGAKAVHSCGLRLPHGRTRSAQERALAEPSQGWPARG